MNTTVVTDEEILREPNSPGAQLAAFRQQQGFTQEYVAGKLHLRVRIIQLIEADDYDRLPEPVFVKGYLRAYAKLLGIHHDPLLEKYKADYMKDTKSEKALWQSKKEPLRAERLLKWFTWLFAIGVSAAVAIWWQQHKSDGQIAVKETANELGLNHVNPEVRLTDLSKMQSLLSTSSSSKELSMVEKKVD